MKDEDAINQMRRVLALKNDCEDLTKAVIALRQDGLQYEHIYDLLSKLRSEVSNGLDEAKEDAILDTMDYVWRKAKW